MTTDADTQLLEKALDIAHPLVAADRDIDPNGIEAELLVDGADQTRVLAHAFILAIDRYIDISQRLKHMPKLFACGWCFKAAGCTEDAWQSAPRMDLDTSQAHALTCPANPLVQRLDKLAEALRGLLGPSCPTSLQWQHARQVLDEELR